MFDITIENGRPPELSPWKESAPERPRESFLETVQEVWEKAERIQDEKNEAVQHLAETGSPDIHNTMIDLQKAEISFKLMMQVRNKIVSAYQEIMRMNV